MPSRIDPARVRLLNDRPITASDYVLYWMQQSQRAEENEALEYAVEQANALGLPLLVGFGLMDDYPDANLRHYTFMLEGLKETAETLRTRGAAFVLQKGHPARVAVALSKRAALVVCDHGYLRHQKAWRARVAAAAKCRVVEVEADVIVPVEAASAKAEFAARTIRPKLYRLEDAYVKPLGRTKLRVQVEKLEGVDGMDLTDVEALCGRLTLDRSVGAVSRFFRGGTAEAKRRVRAFARGSLGHYAERRNHPEQDEVSHLSAYLHFGQISPRWIALEIRRQGGDNARVYLEELLVRRELAMNFAHFNPHYDSYQGLPEWARKTLAEHGRDRRPHVYTLAQLERAETHDPYWNAAMREMLCTGYMHNHMRMYWGKKILEWSSAPEKAYVHALALNNKYFLCGRDANSYTNIGWLFGLHDRPWGEREIYGTVRCMMASGLERKCDIAGYVKKVERLVKRSGAAPL